MAILAGTTAHAEDFTVGPSSDSDCDHHSLEAALGAAAAVFGGDTIRVSTGTYEDLQVQVADPGGVMVHGGWLNCGSAVANAGTTTLRGMGADAVGPVINHVGSGGLTLSNLVITGAVGSSGGGVSSAGSGQLVLRRVIFAGNRAIRGAGLSAVGPIGSIKSVDMEGVAFLENVASISGGGIYAVNAEIRIGGHEPNWFTSNSALGAGPVDGGGAIFVMNSRLGIDTDVPAQQPFMHGNSAPFSAGGAIAMTVSTSGLYATTLVNRDRSRPLVLSGNSAHRGGAVYVHSKGAASHAFAYAYLINTILDDNQASEGGAVYLDAQPTGNLSISDLSMRNSLSDVVVPRCQPHQRCNRLQGNQSSSAIVDLNSGGALAQASFTMDSGYMTGNISAAGSLIGGVGEITVDNSVLSSNLAAASNLIRSTDGELRIRNSTIAGNVIGAPEVVAVNVSASAGQAAPLGISLPALTLRGSIVFQPGRSTLILDSQVPNTLRDLLVNPGHGIVDIGGLNIIVSVQPAFVDPGADDFQLRPESHARNRWTPEAGVYVPARDLNGGPRPSDPPGTPTPYDFGAFEYGAVLDPLFANGFGYE